MRNATFGDLPVQIHVLYIQNLYIYIKLIYNINVNVNVCHGGRGALYRETKKFRQSNMFTDLRTLYSGFLFWIVFFFFKHILSDHKKTYTQLQICKYYVYKIYIKVHAYMYTYHRIVL
jgi:hypothetical protein